MPTIPQGPYSRAAHDYHQLGWSPVPVQGKDWPSKGFTGKQGADPTDEDIARWARGNWGRANIALRLHDGVIAIDVDAHDGKQGADTIAKAQADLGELPPTWSSTSRGKDQPSRIHLYRVPAGLDWSHAEANLSRYGRNVDVLHRGHRYAMVSPSQHPATGAVYLWHDPMGHPSAVAPRPDQLAELPPAWIKVLTEPPPMHDPDPEPRSAQEREGRPGDDLNQRGTWAEILEPLGWTWCFNSGGLGYWRQPDHVGTGHSATAGVRPSGLDLLVNFSTSVPLKTSKGLTRFSVYAELHHSGDRSAAAKALADRGYGTDRNQANTIDGELNVADLLEHMATYLHVDDQGHIWFSLAVAVSAELDGPPLWGMLVGVPSNGKTETIEVLKDRAEHLDELTAAGLLSWQLVRKSAPRKGGALSRIGDRGLITIGDLSTLLAGVDRSGSAREQVFANLRRVFDGSLNRDQAPPPTPASAPDPGPLRWQGRATILCACTPSIDRYAVYADQLGPRFLYLRLPASQPKDELARQCKVRDAADTLEDNRKTARRLAAAIIIHAAKRARTIKLSKAMTETIFDYASVACQGRASVPRYGYGKREIDGLPGIESTPRITGQLLMLARCLLALGLDEKGTLALCRRAALDSMPEIRRRVLEELAKAHGDGELLTGREMARRAQCHQDVARRTLEDLAAIGVAEGEEDEFEALTDWRLTGPYEEMLIKVLSGSDHETDNTHTPTPPSMGDKTDKTKADKEETNDVGFVVTRETDEPPTDPIGGQIFPDTAAWDAAGRPGLSSDDQPTHRCDKCGKTGRPPRMVAVFPHSGCGGLWTSI